MSTSVWCGRVVRVAVVVTLCSASGSMAQEAVKKVKRPRSIGPAAPKGVTVYRDLEYGKAGHQATLLHDALTKADVQSSLELVDGAGHNPGAPGQRERIVAFFDKHLKTHD